MTMQMPTQRYEPLSLFGACYVLELAGGRVYIGWSRNLSNRLSEHWAGSGSIMTRTYPPVRVLQVVFRQITPSKITSRSTTQNAAAGKRLMGLRMSAVAITAPLSRETRRPGSATGDIEPREKAPPAEHERSKRGYRIWRTN